MAKGKAKGKGKGKGKGKALATKGKGKGKDKSQAKDTKPLVSSLAYKTNTRHREHSRVWHWTYKSSLAKGMTPERAKVEAGKAATLHVTGLFG